MLSVQVQVRHWTGLTTGKTILMFDWTGQNIMAHHTTVLSPFQLLGLIMVMALASYGLPWAEGITQTVSLTRSFTSAMLAGRDLDNCDVTKLQSEAILTSCRTPRIADGCDVVAFIIYTVVFFAINWIVRIVLVEPCAHFALRTSHIPEKVNTPAKLEKLRLKRIVKVEKFSQTAMEQLFYGAFTVFGAVTVSSQQWIWPSALWWRGVTSTVTSPFADSLGQEIGVHAYTTKALAGYYIMYAGNSVVSVHCTVHQRKARHSRGVVSPVTPSCCAVLRVLVRDL